MDKKFIKLIVLFLLLISIFIGKKIFYQYENDPQKLRKTEAEITTKSNNQLTVAMSSSEYYPFQYYDKNRQKMVGFDVDLAEKISAKANKHLVIKLMPFSKIIDAVHNKEVDMGISAISPDESRKKLVAFSKPYYSSPFVIVFKRSKNNYSLEQLKGKKLGVEEDTIMSSYTKNYIKDKKINLEIIEFKNSKQMMDSLDNDQIDAVIIEESPALKEIMSKPEHDLSIQNIPETVGSYSVAVQQDWEEGLKISNDTINELFSSGEINKMYEKYGIYSLIQGK